MVFNPNNLAGSSFYMGGLVDENGNVFREKDVMEDDYSEPILVGNKRYPVVSVREMNAEQGRKLINVIILDGKTELQYLLTEDEYKEAVE